MKGCKRLDKIMISDILIKQELRDRSHTGIPAFIIWGIMMA